MMHKRFLNVNINREVKIITFDDLTFIGVQRYSNSIKTSNIKTLLGIL